MAEFQSFTLSLDKSAKELLTYVGICDASHSNITSEFDSKIVKKVALWDTGATNCVITPSCAKSLGIRPISVAMTRHAGGVGPANVYLVNIILPNRILVKGVRVTECSDQAGDFDVIIGMDVITTGDFVITNVGGKTTFSFRVPSKETIDFVKEERTEGDILRVVLNVPCPKCSKPHTINMYYGISLEDLNRANVERCRNIREEGIFTCDNCHYDIDLRQKKYEWEQNLKQKIFF